MRRRQAAMTEPWGASDLVERFLGDSLTTDRSIWAFVRTVPPEFWDTFWTLASEQLATQEARELGRQPLVTGQDQSSVGPNPFARDALRELRARLLSEERQRRGRP
jgi:hypothetical protein